MVSARTTAFFALVIACAASGVFSSPLPIMFTPETRDITFEGVTNFVSRSEVHPDAAEGSAKRQINVMPEVIPTSSDGTTIRVYNGRRQVNLMPADIATSSDGVNIRVYSGKRQVNAIPAELAMASDGTTIRPYNKQRRQLATAGTFVPPAGTVVPPAGTVAAPAAVAPPAAAVVAPAAAVAPPAGAVDPATGTTFIPVEQAASSDGTTIVPFASKGRKRQLLNMMPAEIAVSSDGVTMRPV